MTETSTTGEQMGVRSVLWIIIMKLVTTIEKQLTIHLKRVRQRLIMLLDIVHEVFELGLAIATDFYNRFDLNRQSEKLYI